MGTRLATACLMVGFVAASLAAAPPVVRHVPHPYDPDWPDVFWVLANKCSGCHRPGTDRLDFSSYEALMAAGQADGMPAVVPGNVEASQLWEYVVWNVEARPGSPLPDEPQMPPEKHEWLTAGQLAQLRRWIERGGQQFVVPPTCRPPLIETDFPSAKQCAACHPRQFDQWSRSMHHYAQHSPAFEAFNLALVERTGGTIGTFCTRCHTPIGTILGENESVRNVHRSRISMEGITCVVCHRRKDGVYKASGRIAIQPGQILDTCMYGPFDDAASEQVGSHPSAGLPYLRSSQFCAECHDVTSPEGVRLEEAFSEWQNSPAAAEGITCQQCHMGPVQGVPIPSDQRPWGRAAEVPGVAPEQLPLRRLSDHTFAGPDYSLLPDTEFPHKLDWMYETDYRDTSRLTPYQLRTLEELRRSNRRHLQLATEKRLELLMNAADIQVEHPPEAAAGQSLPVRVTIRSKFGGHHLPTGFTAERQCWVFVELRDPQGRVAYRSGDFDRNGDLRDDHSHDVLAGYLPYDRHLLNLQSKFIALTHRGTERSVILSVNRHLQPINVLRPAPFDSQNFGRPPAFRVAKGSLPPLKSLSQTYPVPVGDCSGTYLLTVRLQFRHLPPVLLDHIGIPQLKHLLESVVLDEYQAIVRVSASDQ